MAIVEIIGGPITHKYLMGKTKFELAEMYMRLLRETERDAKDAALYRAQRAPQNGAVPEGMLDLVEALDAAMVESLMGEGAGIWKGNRGKLRNRLPENVGAILAKMRTLLAAAHAPEADHPAPREITREDIDAAHFAKIRESDLACAEDERAKGDVYEAYKTWPDDIRAKLSFHDLRRMSGWAPRAHVGDWRIDTSAGRPILVYQNCSVIEAETAAYVLGLIARDAPPPAGQPEGVEELARSIYEAWRAERHSALPSAHPWEAVSPFTQKLWERIARRLASAQRDAGSAQQGDKL